MNFCFSVAVLLGAINASNKSMKKWNHDQQQWYIEMDEESQKLFKDDVACQQCVDIWEQLFENVYSTYQEKIQQSVTLTEGNNLRFQFQQEIWKTHTNIIEIAVRSPKSQELLLLLPEPERKFGIGWARMVDILAASTFPTDLITIVKDGTGFLPFQMVTDQIVADWNHVPKRKKYN